MLKNIRGILVWFSWMVLMGAVILNCFVNFGATSVVCLVLFSMMYICWDVLRVLKSNRKLIMLVQDVLHSTLKDKEEHE